MFLPPLATVNCPLGLRKGQDLLSPHQQDECAMTMSFTCLVKTKDSTDDYRMENGNTANCYEIIQGKCGNTRKMEEKQFNRRKTGRGREAATQGEEKRARDQEKKQKSVGESLTSKTK